MPEQVDARGRALHRLAHRLNDSFQQFHCLGLPGVEGSAISPVNALRAEGRIHTIQCRP